MGVFVQQQQHVHSRTLEQVQGRMFELITATSISRRMMHEAAPVTACRMAHFTFGSCSQDLVQVRSLADTQACWHPLCSLLMV